MEDQEQLDVYLEESEETEDLQTQAKPLQPRKDWMIGTRSYLPVKAVKLALRLQTNQRALARNSQAVPIDLPTRKDPKHTPTFASPTELVNSTIREAKLLLNRDPEEAVELLKSRLRDGLVHADLYYLQGEALRVLERLEEAEEALLAALAMKLHSPYAYYSLGLVYLDQGRMDRAVPLLQHFLAQIVPFK